MIINKIINKIISLDSEAAKKLEILTNQYLFIHITNINLKLFFTYQNEKLIINNHKTHNDFTVTSITGSLTAFIKQAPGDLIIHGDPMLAQNVQQVLQNIDLDLEAKIAEFTGDVIAYEICKFFKNQTSIAKHIGASLKSNTKDYLLEEAKLFATKAQVQEFMDEVDKLHADIARCEARVKKCVSAIS